MVFQFDVIAPFEGVIEAVFRQAGETVEEGEPLFMLKANNLAHPIQAPVTGLALNIEVNQGEFVLAGMILATITESDQS